MAACPDISPLDCAEADADFNPIPVGRPLSGVIFRRGSEYRCRVFSFLLGICSREFMGGRGTSKIINRKMRPKDSEPRWPN